LNTSKRALEQKRQEGGPNCHVYIFSSLNVVYKNYKVQHSNLCELDQLKERARLRSSIEERQGARHRKGKQAAGYLGGKRNLKLTAEKRLQSKTDHAYIRNRNNDPVDPATDSGINYREVRPKGYRDDTRSQKKVFEAEWPQKETQRDEENKNLDYRMHRRDIP
jgi:hypothetical protein